MRFLQKLALRFVCDTPERKKLQAIAAFQKIIALCFDLMTAMKKISLRARLILITASGSFAGVEVARQGATPRYSLRINRKKLKPIANRCKKCRPVPGIIVNRASQVSRPPPLGTGTCLLFGKDIRGARERSTHFVPRWHMARSRPRA